MTINLFSNVPARSMEPDDFVTAADTTFSEFNTILGQINTTTAALSGMASGTASAIPYTFSTTTTDADPGAGVIRLNNATQSSASQLYMDLLGSNSVDFTTFIDTIQNGTGVYKGYGRITKISDTSKFILFSISAWTTATGYRKLSFSNVVASSSNPFSNGDSVLFQFSQSGGSTVTKISDSGIVTSAATYDVSIPSGYSSYQLVITNLQPATAAATLQLRTLYGGTPETGANYYGHLAVSSHNSTAYVGIVTSAATSLQITTSLPTSSTRGYCGRIILDSSISNTSINKVITGTASADTNSTGMCMNNFSGIVVSTGTALSAFRFFMSSGNIASAQFILYGLT